MTQLNVSIPPSLENWVNTRLAQGRYVDAADYVRDLVRRDQDGEFEDRRLLQELIDEGLASGVIDEEPETVVERIIARRHARQD